MNALSQQFAGEPLPSWPPDYRHVLMVRSKRIIRLRTYPELLVGAKEFYAENTAEAAIRFIEDWGVTYDPRNAGGGESAPPTIMPFIMFERQRQFVRFLHSCLVDEENGLTEKSRDMGATWLCVGFSIWMWRFLPGSAIGWGSRKAMLVDHIGDPDSIFEKMRMFIRYMPRFLWPVGFSEEYMTSGKIINPENESTITGESGDSIGRGGRKRIYFKDESAHYEHPESIEAALGDNTRVQIDISSVNGPANVFHRRREAGVEWIEGREMPKGMTRVFVMDWRDHPAKTQEWYEQRRAKAEEEGLLHLFAQEVDRNYFAAVEGVIIPAEWVNSAIDADIKLGIDMETGGWAAGLDVADDVGGDLNALVKRKGVKVKYAEDWGGVDTGVTTRRAVEVCDADMRIMYDCIGVGAGVKSEVNRLVSDKKMRKGLKFVPWNAGASVEDPDEYFIPGDERTPRNKDLFGNLKAQAWWAARLRFERTHRAVTQGTKYHVDELICIPKSLPRLQQLRKELSQAVSKKSGALKLIVDKNPPGTRSPNIADALIECYFPVEGESTYDATMSWVR